MRSLAPTLAPTLAVAISLALSWLLLRQEPDGQRPLFPPLATPVPDGQDLGQSPVLPGPETARAAVVEEPTDEHASPSGRSAEDAWDEIGFDGLEERSDAELLELAGLPADTPLSPRLNRPGPPDPLERGEATLVLRLFDQAEGEPFASHVVLWQLSAPANAYWTAGDQDVAQGAVAVAGHEFPNLAAGEYRAVVMGEQADAPHQPSFFVSGKTEVMLFIEPPVKRPVRLTVVGASAPPGRMEAAFLPIRFRSTSEMFPRWARPRQIQPSYDGLIISQSFQWAILEYPQFKISEPEPEWLLLRTTSVGFDLGAFPENTRGIACEQEVRLRANDWSGMVELENKEPGELLEVHLDLSVKNDGD